MEFQRIEITIFLLVNSPKSFNFCFFDKLQGRTARLFVLNLIWLRLYEEAIQPS
jgi:hypothetical protein